MSIPSNLVPKTSDSCSIKTSKGTLLVELWTNECPSTVDAFIECCKDHTFVDKFFYWNDDASYPCIILDYQLNSKIAPIPSEYHSRLAFSTDGILGWDTQKQTWFITSEQWLTTNKDNNVFGKVVGDSRYVLRDIIKGEKDPDDNSQYLFPPIIQSIEILSRNVDTPKTIESIKLAPKKHTQNVKLHFNTEDENDDEQDTLPILTGNKRNYLTEEGNDILNQTPKKMKIKLHKSITGNTSSGLSKKNLILMTIFLIMTKEKMLHLNL
ncbi:hypothetical protein TBLA_0A00550 [Henningerozyma blattae CBS 6284]|uniref:PPIase cyclophilin-type domain-containing protein n=1 Tax=Henningerozyma blattae (strain ATCC 34711 / CBS 6284 / DSM 70876 / NBRC 10599 / NRRL Y-10934 / UCD 77-7) TaxID=1071380 RepID=I2GUQ4_HENB6|nr:hypothetical protein TBLA_0A00550 [Tetrapisispora blattae CBS 6284]CCH57856.1 hypothetical protein TBLA_0A00550 [Tetrapisispora blattae CBS 6284]